MSSSHAAAMRILGGLLEARTGQQLIAGRQWRIETALKPVARSLGLDGIEALVATLVSAKDDVIATRVVEALLNNETSFFRDPGVFELLGSAAFDKIRSARKESRRLRIWSAGCSTGQEPYSLAIMLREAEARLGAELVGLQHQSEPAPRRTRAGPAVASRCRW